MQSYVDKEFDERDEKFMKEAIRLAKKASMLDEVPVGAVIVKDGKIIARAFNRSAQKKCALYHAEMIAIKRATKKLNDFRLNGCTMYVTLEPCAMCSGAIALSRIDFVCFGAYENKSGFCKSVYNVLENSGLNHKTYSKGGLLEEECASLLKKFFKDKRDIKS